MAIRVLVDEQSFIDETATEWNIDERGYLRLRDAEHTVTSVFAPGWTTAGRWTRDSAPKSTVNVESVDTADLTADASRATSLALRV